MAMVVEKRPRDRRIAFDSRGPRAVEGDAAVSIADRESTRIVWNEAGPQVAAPVIEGDPSARVCFGRGGPIVRNGDGTVELPIQTGGEDADELEGDDEGAIDDGAEDDLATTDAEAVTTSQRRGRRRRNRR